jgi:hypothetical protein
VTTVIAYSIPDITLKAVHAFSITVLETVAFVKVPGRTIEVKITRPKRPLVAHAIADPRCAKAAIPAGTILARFLMTAIPTIEPPVIAVEVKIGCIVVANTICYTELLTTAVLVVAIPALFIAISSIVGKGGTVEVQLRASLL